MAESIWMRPEQPARGPRPSFSRARLTEAAIRIADAEGLDALSMRRVAAEIGSGTMSLYRYVSSKDDLIDLMSDAVAPEFFPPSTDVTGDWRADVRALAVCNRQAMLRHPWLTKSPATRQSAGPNRVRLMEDSLGLVDGLGLSMDAMLNVMGAIAAYVNGFVSAELAEAEARRRTGMDLMQWMASQASFIESLLRTGDYPLFSRMVTEAGRELTDPDERFAFGLDRLLDGIAATLPPAP
ncbi:TetR/AcrR family transcriptional regulator [Nonomuraea sp. NPDC046802]|uniref:TetR/AcrR family transcriptional regulator n=1 Tax=Nonomuraea sp. NPDC046802 TaxID=3154919 RepID=UPI00340E3BA7